MFEQVSLSFGEDPNFVKGVVYVQMELEKIIKGDDL